jgi:flagellar hook-associated protein 2
VATTSAIEGLISGLNTTEIIDAIIKSERHPAVLMEEQQTEKTNIVSAWKAFQAKLLAFSTQAKKLTKQATFQSYTVNVSDDTVLGATSSGKVSTGSYDVRVLSVARNHQLASQGVSDVSLAQFGTGSITLQLGSGSARTITIDSSNNSLTGIQNAINNADAGVTASIINDGSTSKPYRLVLSGNKTGQANAISVSTNLVGGTGLNYSTASFDVPETLSRNSSSTAQIALGSTAAYSGSSNKLYTFTVAGSGAQTVGSNNVTLNWSDGTNSGSIIVSQADTEVALVGEGAEGLKISLGSGVLYGGDTFQVGTFAPLLQQASDARIALGSSGGTGSPITVSSASNEFTNVLGGLTLTAKKESEDGTSVSVQAGVDTSGLKDTIDAWISSYNDVISYITEQNKYDSETGESGVLFGDFTLQTIQASLRGAVGSRISGLSGSYNQLVAIGIRSTSDGTLTISDSSKLQKALTDNLDEVIKLFTSSGESSNAGIEFLSSTDATKVGSDYSVDITQAATHGRYRGTNTADPAATPITLSTTNNRLKLVVDGLTSGELVLADKTYASANELVTEIQERVDADDTIGDRNVTVSWVDLGNGTGYLQFESATWGSASKINVITGLANNAYSAIGLANGTSEAGADVAGTINGEAATGSGQILSGKDGNKTTAGLKLKVTMTSNQVLSGSDGTITLAKGVASLMDDRVSSLTLSGDGLVDRRIKSYQNQIADLKDRIEEFDARLAKRRESLQDKWAYLEEMLASLQSTETQLTTQFSQLNSNWSFNNKNS